MSFNFDWYSEVDKEAHFALIDAMKRGSWRNVAQRKIAARCLERSVSLSEATSYWGIPEYPSGSIITTRGYTKLPHGRYKVQWIWLVDRGGVLAQHKAKQILVGSMNWASGKSTLLWEKP